MKLGTYAVLTILAATVGVVRADVLTFEDKTAGECGGISSPFTEGAFTFSFPQGSGPGQTLACINTASPTSNSFRFSGDGTQTLGVLDSNVSTGPGALTMTATDSGTFSLTSVDLAQFFKSGDFAFPNNASGVTVTGNLQGGGTVSDLLSITIVSDGPGGNADFATFLLPGTFTNLTSVLFTPTGGSAGAYYFMDNITLSETSAVPEPSAILLLATILAFLGWSLPSALRRQRRTQA